VLADGEDGENFTLRIPVERGELHGGTYRVPDLTAPYVSGNPIHYRQFLGAVDSSAQAALVELDYYVYARNTWVPTGTPRVAFGDTTGGRAFVDVYSSRQDALAGAMKTSRPSLLRPLATRLQIGGGGVYPNGTVRDTLALMTSPFTRHAGPVMHVARIGPSAAAEELFTVASPPLKRQAGVAGPALPRQVPSSSHGGLRMVDVDIPHKGAARPTANRIGAADTVTLVAGDTHNDALRRSRKPTAGWVPAGVATTWERMHARGVASVMDVDAVTRDEVGIMPWSLTLGFYKSTEPHMRNAHA
jgi:hypothetical protein